MVAYGMITSGTGKSAGPMKDRRDRRSKDARRKREMYEYDMDDVIIYNSTDYHIND